VVRHASGAVYDAPGVCVGFAGGSVTMEGALQLAAQQYGLEYRAAYYNSSMGDELCQVDNEPRGTPQGGWSASNCFNGGYWATYTSTGGGPWAATGEGISNVTLHDGDAAGFAYEPNSSREPPPPSPAGVCPTPVPPPTTPAATPPPAPPPSPRASSAPVPPSPPPAVPQALAPITSPSAPAGSSPTPPAAPRSPFPPVAAGPARPSAPPTPPGSTGYAAAAAAAVLMSALAAFRLLRGGGA